jgi:hypothetical protein
VHRHDPNLVIDSKIINCPAEDADSSGACRDTSVCMWIEAANVTIRNSQINGAVWIDDPSQNYSFTVTDSTFDVGLVNTSTSLENNASRGIGKSHFTATRVNVFKGGAGIWCEYDCSVTDSYIHDQDTDEGGHDHQSGIRQGSGGTGSGYAGQTFTHNTVLCNAPDVAPDAGCSADFTGYGDFAFIQYNTVQKNLLLSTTGGTCAYGGNSTGRPFVNGSHNVWQDNVFQRGPSGRGHHGRVRALRLLVRDGRLGWRADRQRVHGERVGRRDDRGPEHVDADGYRDPCRVITGHGHPRVNHGHGHRADRHGHRRRCLGALGDRHRGWHAEHQPAVRVDDGRRPDDGRELQGRVRLHRPWRVGTVVRVHDDEPVVEL